MRGHIIKSIAEIKDERIAFTMNAGTVEQLIEDTRQQFIDLRGAWLKANLQGKQEIQATLFQSGLAFNTLQRFMCLNQNKDLAELVFSALLDVMPGDDLMSGLRHRKWSG